MTIICLIFQPVLASLHYTQACSYKNDTIITIEGGGGGGRRERIDMTGLSSRYKTKQKRNYKKKKIKKKSIQANVIYLALKLSTVNITK